MVREYSLTGERATCLDLLMFTKDDEGAIWRNDFNRYVWHPALRAVRVDTWPRERVSPAAASFRQRRARTGATSGALARYLGHADPAFALRVYCHLMPGSPDRMRLAIDRAFSESPDCPEIAWRARQACDLRRYHFAKL
jgi:hypothetical protein